MFSANIVALNGQLYTNYVQAVLQENTCDLWKTLWSYMVNVTVLT